MANNKVTYPTHVVGLVVAGAIIIFVGLFLPHISCEVVEQRGDCSLERPLLDPDAYSDGLLAGIGSTDYNYLPLLIIVLCVGVLYTAWRGRGLYTMGAALFNTVALQLWATQYDLQRGQGYLSSAVEFTRATGWYVLLVGVVPVGIAIYMLNANADSEYEDERTWLERIRTSPPIMLALVGLLILTVGTLLPLDCANDVCDHAFNFNNFGERYEEDGILEHFWNGVRDNLVGVIWLLLFAAAIYPITHMAAIGPHYAAILFAVGLRFLVSLDNDASIGGGWPVLILGVVALIGSLVLQWQLKRTGALPEPRLKPKKKKIKPRRTSKDRSKPAEKQADDEADKIEADDEEADKVEEE